MELTNVISKNDKKIVYNRVSGLKFLYDNFPYYFNEERIKMFFVNSKKELVDLMIDDSCFDTIVLKRSGNHKQFISDIKCKDNRFFTNIKDLKNGLSEFDDVFVYCVECHKFRESEDYYSDKLAIAQFSTRPNENYLDRISFIPSRKPGVSTRDNEPYILIEYPYNYENVFSVRKINKESIAENHLDDIGISYLAKDIHKMIDSIRDYLIEQESYNTFQLIIRIDSYLNLLPIDFRTPEAWATI